MQTLILIVHVLVSIALIVLVLLQQGKGADAGAAFGSGASATVFGARGSTSFLSRMTAVLAAVFFITSLSLAYFSGRIAVHTSVTQISMPQPSAPAAVQTTAPPAAGKTAAPTDLPPTPKK